MNRPRAQPILAIHLPEVPLLLVNYTFIILLKYYPCKSFLRLRDKSKSIRTPFPFGWKLGNDNQILLILFS